jgi:co-chaperonin GroES (HSP10)
MKVKPLGDRVLLKRVETEEEVRGSIIIPDTDTGQDIKINDEEHTIVREDDILAIIEK